MFKVNCQKNKVLSPTTLTGMNDTLLPSPDHDTLTGMNATQVLQLQSAHSGVSFILILDGCVSV